MERSTRAPSPVVIATVATAFVLLLLAMWTLITRPLSQADEVLGALRSHWTPSEIALREMRAQLAELRAYELAQLQHADDAERSADYDRRIAGNLAAVQRELARFEATAITVDSAQLGKVKQRLQAYLQAHHAIAAAVDAGDVARARALSTEAALPARRALFEDILVLTASTHAASPSNTVAGR